ncbi:MAG: hypothetical protein R2704_08165 [Microthrixaceae bacterium]|nr:hypothetical protein [Microthrixaceae bacterium]
MRTIPLTRPARVTLAATMALAAAGCHTSPPPTGTIRVSVQQDGGPSASSGRAYTSAGGGAIERFSTGANGTVTVRGPAGRWTITASGYAPDPSDPWCSLVVEGSRTVTMPEGASVSALVALEPTGLRVCA